MAIGVESGAGGYLEVGDGVGRRRGRHQVGGSGEEALRRARELSGVALQGLRRQRPVLVRRIGRRVGRRVAERIGRMAETVAVGGGHVRQVGGRAARRQEAVLANLHALGDVVDQLVGVEAVQVGRLARQAAQVQAAGRVVGAPRAVLQLGLDGRDGRQPADGAGVGRGARSEVAGTQLERVRVVQLRRLGEHVQTLRDGRAGRRRRRQAGSQGFHLMDAPTPTPTPTPKRARTNKKEQIMKSMSR